jgi:hypothetical protein
MFCLHKRAAAEGFLLLTIAQDHVCFLMVRIHFNRRILTFS